MNRCRSLEVDNNNLKSVVIIIISYYVHTVEIQFKRLYWFQANLMKKQLLKLTSLKNNKDLRKEVG